LIFFLRTKPLTLMRTMIYKNDWVCSLCSLKRHGLVLKCFQIF
jgi:hypothetical protein